MPELLVEKSIIVVTAAALILSRLPKLWFDRSGRLRPMIIFWAWSMAACSLLLQLLITPLNDDEVYYLAYAFAAQHGEVSGHLPMRVWLFYPFLALGLSSAATLLLGRLTMLANALLIGCLVTSIARKIDKSTSTAPILGALAVIALANLPMILLRPEYFACLFLLFGIWALVAAPHNWPRPFSIFMGLLLITLACTTSLRLALFIAVGPIIVLFESGRMRRLTAFAFSILGIIAGSIPSAIYLAQTSSLESLLYWNFTLVQKAQFIDLDERLVLPAMVVTIALAGCYYLCRIDASFWTRRIVVILLAIATISAVLNPQKNPYTLGPWLALSFIVMTAALSQWRAMGADSRKKRLYTFSLGFLFTMQIWPSMTRLADPSSIRAATAELVSQFALVNWLESVTNGRPVACVVPYHPIRASNAWHMWNAHYYCYISDPALNLEINPDFENTLQSGQLSIIQWDAWPKASQQSNILQYSISRGLIDKRRVAVVAERLSKNYRMVQWAGPLPEEYGGGSFLLRHDIKLDDRVIARDSSFILEAK